MFEIENLHMYGMTGQQSLPCPILPPGLVCPYQLSQALPEKISVL